jgi:hypothetical protein
MTAEILLRRVRFFLSAAVSCIIVVQGAVASGPCYGIAARGLTVNPPDCQGTTSFYPSAPSLGTTWAGVADDSGKRVHGHAVAHAPSGSGIYDLVWNGIGRNGKTLASGIYLLRMTALNQSLKSAGAFERKITLMP